MLAPPTGVLSLWRANASATDLSRALEAATPGSLHAVNLSGNVALGDDAVTLLLASGHLPSLRTLDLSGVPVGADALAALCASPEVAGLETLLLGGVSRDALRLPFGDEGRSRWRAVATCEVGDAGLVALSNSPHLRSLKRLDVSYVEAGADAWVAFVSAPWLGQLTHFGVAMVDPPAQTFPTLFARAPRLVSVGLDCVHLGDAGAEALAASACAKQLVRAVLPTNGFTRRGVEALVKGALPVVEVLDLQGVAIDEPLIEVLRKRATPRLHTLVLDNASSITTGNVETWYDQGAVVGESAEVLRLYDVKARYFPEDEVRMTDSPSVWPMAWLDAR